MAGINAVLAVRDVQRDFKSKTPVDKFRFAPSHNRSPQELNVIGLVDCRGMRLNGDPTILAVIVELAISMPFGFSFAEAAALVAGVPKADTSFAGLAHLWQM